MGAEVPEDNDAHEEPRPYRPLDTSRIKLTGRGEWIVEPDVIGFDVVPPSRVAPNVLEGDVEQTLKLFQGVGCKPPAAPDRRIVGPAGG